MRVLASGFAMVNNARPFWHLSLVATLQHRKASSDANAMPPCASIYTNHRTYRANRSCVSASANANLRWLRLAHCARNNAASVARMAATPSVVVGQRHGCEHYRAAKHRTCLPLQQTVGEPLRLVLQPSKSVAWAIGALCHTLARHLHAFPRDAGDMLTEIP